MNNATLKKICAELSSELCGKKFGKIFPLARHRLAIDFRLNDSRYLFISVEPTAPRLYLIKRRLRDLEKQTKNPSPFILFLRNRLSNAVLNGLEKISDDRIVRFDLSARNEVGRVEKYGLIAQLTGRSANLFLLDERGFILDSLRQTNGPGQEAATRYSPPLPPPEKERTDPENEKVFPTGDFTDLSAALDDFYSTSEAEQRFQNMAATALQKLKRKISKRKRLVKNLNRDLAGHGQAEKWKRYGDLLLANLATAERTGGRVLVTDYYDENTPTLEIEIDPNDELSEAAAKFFKLYAKARNAQTEIAKRLELTEAELNELAVQKERLEQAIAEKDENALSLFIGNEREQSAAGATQRNKDNFSGARKFISTDGFEILVGRRARDNDQLTFRVAKSLDLWLHAADYPGSHVIVRNPDRREIPPATLLEAAQLAAFYSQAGSEPKAAVHYTQKKFVNKPKGAAPGLVSLASFKTILVEPKITAEKKI